ncbi:HD-GYP domain-containing protein [Vallitalea sp.]|uniref:HD-GYP domain-containing protein n=1 Tax=Vallitalea sp. TaxID=1882829 RepID=UPI0025E8AB9F|nr:HD-GYP domain-containing protein [Vallitalea sp.]MCT4687079.1 HD-GYP domain-containing protein [Vallitalea sp.]
MIDIFDRLRQKRSHRYHDIIECLIGALEAKDTYTRGHSDRVAHMAYDIGKKYGLGKKELEDLHLAGHLHDIGKIGIPDNILNKPSKLQPYEYNIVKNHSRMGYDILMKSKNLKDIAIIVLYHHERWDGKGYPEGLKEKEIPLASRIIAISDSIDAMISKRSYKKSLSWNECHKEVISNKGIQFDPYLVNSIESLWSKWEKSL